ncbi:MAG: family 1 glycosylhydrolase [Acidobacteriota bacterium]
MAETTAQEQPPDVEQSVRVLSRLYPVDGVAPPMEDNATLPALSCLDDEAQSERLDVLWEREVDAENVFVLRRLPGLRGSFDVFGVNACGRFAVRFDPRAKTPLGRHVQEPATRNEQTDWGQPCARGLTAQLMRAANLGKPVYATDNGLYDNDDTSCPPLLMDHVDAVGKAVRRGADVRGYFHGSLVDNFEWAEGWSTHFGLLALDRATCERTPRRSAHLYRRICRAHGVPDELRAELDIHQEPPCPPRKDP